MSSSGSLSLLLLPPLSCFLLQDPSLAFSLQSCTIFYSENVSNMWVTCKGRELTVVSDNIPRNAASLDLSWNLLAQITRTDFRGLSKIKSLEVQRNLISHIDGGAFTDLAELLILIMNDNKLTNLTDNMFQGLSKLATLALSSNHISFISPVAFQSLDSLKWVELGSNHLHQVKDIVPLLKLPMIQILFLGYNKLNSFQSDDLPLNISNVRSLSLSLNPLRKFSITTDVFPYLQSLDFSKCSSNMEWKVENKTFLRSLTSLFFSGTYISFDTYREMLQTTDSLQKLVLTYIKEWLDGLVDIACKIPSLRSLDAAACQIETIDDNLQRSCSQLTELILSANSLSGMSEHSLQSLTQLSLLQLHGNYLPKVPRALRRLSTLDVLDLSFNVISELDCLDFQHLTRLTELNLNHNRISSLRGCVFQNLNDLKVLNMGQNAVFTIQDAFKVSLRKLESLNLHSSVLVKLKQGDFRNLSSFRFLDLEADTAIPMDYGIFEGLDHLQTLRLSVSSYEKDFFRLSHVENLTLHLTFAWNPQSSQLNDESPFSNSPNLKKLVLKVYDTFTTHISPNMLGGLKSLEYLMTEKFFVKSVHPDMFKYTPQLKGLQIVHSDVLYLTPELFWPIPNLKALDLSDNELRSLDFLAQANLPALSWLKLSNNKLSIINEMLLHSLPALTYLDLTGNPLTCECSNSGFNLWVLSSNQTQVINGHQYTCAFPVSQRGKKFLEFDVHSCWIDASFLCFICCSCLIVFTLLASFTYHFLRWKKVASQRYDAFVSYNINDEAWVCRELLPVLEDFEPGKSIVENITEAIYGSRKTICVISRSYLQSKWCSREIQMASFRLFDDLVKRCTYLSWPRAAQHTGVFWQKVQRSLEANEALDSMRTVLTP
uniref:TIR domain-containing protein n=1 Tax=Amphiprion ocellaris TaxID=80972 RepID=A0AAQ5YIC5_AMPOC